jgi:Ca2+-binding RTX toxin-like protein
MPIILGTPLHDVLTGTNVRDVIAGFGGNDTIVDGGGTADEVYGGSGDDTYVISAAGTTIVEAIDEGTDTVRTALPAFLLAANVENLTFTGSGDFIGRGNSGNNVILGGAGVDLLYGFEGRDVLYGGAGDDLLDGGTGVANELQGSTGDDVYIVNAAGDSIVEFAGEGTDTVRTSVRQHLLAANVENVFFTGSGDFIGFGNALDNVVMGGAGADYLDGGAGRDILIGGSGNDTLIGGAGAANELYGGDGDDVYILDAPDSIVELVNGGIDTVLTNLRSFILPDNVENLTVRVRGFYDSATLIGNALSNVITGSPEDDWIDGGLGGPDTLIGGNGTDTYIVRNIGDVVTESFGDGAQDTIMTSLSICTLPLYVERLIYTGMTSFTGATSALGGTIYGGPGADSLTGSGQAFGGPGDDRYYGFENIVENPGEGNDTMYLTGGGGYEFRLPENVENLVWSGQLSGFTQVSGNQLVNEITIAATVTQPMFIQSYGGDDRLTAGNGGTVFSSGSGNDVMTGSTAVVRDDFYFLGNETGVDRIIGFQSGTDRIAIDRTVAGQGLGNPFVLVEGPGASAASAINTMIHDTTTGLLSYDRDGSGPGTPVPLAYLDIGVTLASTDFFFI